MNILVSISSLVLLVTFHFSDGSYALPPNNYHRYMPAPINNNGKFPVPPQQSTSINFGTNQPPFFQTLPSVAAGSSSGSSFIPGYRPIPSVPAPTTSPYGVLSSRAASPAINSYFPSSANVPSDNYFALQTAATNFRQWPVPSPSVSTFPLRPAPLNNQMNRPPTSSKYGSSVPTNLQSQQQQLNRQIIFTSTAKPPTYSVSFSTSARVGAGTRFGATDYGNSSNPNIRGTTTPGKFATGDNGFSNWYGTSGGGVGGQPRGLVQSIPSYSSPPSSPPVGGRGKGGENVSAPKFNPQIDTVWGTGPWEGKVPEKTPQPQPKISPEPISGSRLKFSTESSRTSSYSPSAPKTQEKTGKTKSHYSKTSPTNLSSKSSPSDSFGLPSYSASIPSNSSKESFSVSSGYSWNTQSHQKEKGDFKQKYSDNTQQRNSFNAFDRDNEIDEEDEELDLQPETEKKIRVKKGSFTWKGADGKVYEVRYTADALGMHLEEDENEDKPNSYSAPIRIVASEEEFLKELKSIESDSANEVESEEEDIELEHSSSNRDSSFANTIPNSNKKYNSNYPLSQKEIHDIYRLQDAFQNSNEVWNHRRGDISFPPFNGNNERGPSTSTTETPKIVISFGTGTSSTSPLFIPLSSSYETGIDRSYEHSSSSFPNRDSYYVVDPQPTPETQDSITTSSQNPNRENSPSKKLFYAIRHHSYTKSHSSSDNDNNIPYEETKEQPIIPYNRKQYKRSNSRSGKVSSTSVDSENPNSKTKNTQNSSEQISTGKNSNSQTENTPAVASRVISRPSRFRSSFRQKSSN